MANLNKVMLIGNLCADAELRHTPKGTAVADVRLAINRKSKDQNGDLREEVVFVDVTLWGKTAENVSKYVGNGSPIFIEGRLQLDQWEDRETGQKRQKLKVVGDFVQFLGTRPDSGGQREESRREPPRNPNIPSNRQRDDGPDPQSRPPADQPGHSTGAGGAFDPDDDIPF